VCSTTKPVLGLLPPIVHDDPGDDSSHLDMPRDEDTFAGPGPVFRPSTAPHAEELRLLSDRLDVLSGRVLSLEEYQSQSAELAFDELFAQLARLERELSQRTDRLAQTAAHMAVGLVTLRQAQERNWRRRFAAWFQANVYSSRAR